MTNLKYTPEEPIAAIATALAPGALGIVRASGKDCISLVANVFSRPKALLGAAGNSIVYGWIVRPECVSAGKGCEAVPDGEENRTGRNEALLRGTLDIATRNGAEAECRGTPVKKERIDEVLVSVFKAPKSFTGEDMIEISCHGGVNVVQSVYNLLLENGFRQAERGEFTFRAYINGKTDLTKAEAIREIIDSKTNESRSHAAGRLAGNLFETIDGVKKLIVDTLAAIEVEIEYPEDEETIADSFDSSDLRKAETQLEQLAASWNSEKIYQDGARVVLCGKTNAGKSSLFNALLKEDRAIVSDIEGTTRDFIESWIDFDGIPARLFDTAGLRETADVIEAVGVERTRDLSGDADLILYLVDSSAGISDEDRSFIEKAESPVIVVYNKADKVEEIPEENFGCPSVRIAAKKGTGLSELSVAVRKVLSKGGQTDRSQTGLGSERQKVSVEQALECVRHALSLTEDYALDAVVQDLEDCLDHLGAVTGEVTPDDVLGSIFSRFCVGK